MKFLCHLEEIRSYSKFPGPLACTFFLPPLLQCSLSLGCRSCVVDILTRTEQGMIGYLLHFVTLWLSVMVCICWDEVSLFQGESQRLSATI